MTPEQQRIAIAEWCGRNGWWCPQHQKLVSEYSLGYQNRHANCTESARQMPDYLNDLNAMWEAEERLEPRTLYRGGEPVTKWFGYQDHLINVCSRTETPPSHATAAQRAEALLRTIGKWTDATTEGKGGGATPSTTPYSLRGKRG